MKKLVAVNKDACMACLACANACSEAFYKRTDVSVSCIQIGAKKTVLRRYLPVLSAANVQRSVKQGRLPRTPRACTW